MKEATGELNMTVIVVIAIAAIAGLFYAFIWPAIQTNLKNQTCKTFGDYKYSANGGADCIQMDSEDTDTIGNTTQKGYCCPNK